MKRAWRKATKVSGSVVFRRRVAFVSSSSSVLPFLDDPRPSSIGGKENALIFRDGTWAMIFCFISICFLRTFICYYVNILEGECGGKGGSSLKTKTNDNEGFDGKRKRRARVFHGAEARAKKINKREKKTLFSIFLKNCD